MKRYNPTKHIKKMKEEDEEAKSEKAIKDLIDLDWGKDEEAQNTAVALFKALVLADTTVADKFIKNVSDYTSGLKIETFKEGSEDKMYKRYASSYYMSELKNLLPIDEYGVAVKMSTTNGNTKTMRVNKEFLKVFSNFVKSNKLDV